MGEKEEEEEEHVGLDGDGKRGKRQEMREVNVEKGI